MNLAPETYLFPTGQAPVAYYGDADFGAANGTAFNRDDATGAMLSDVEMQTLVDAFPLEVKNNIDLLQGVWRDKVPALCVCV